MKEEEGDKNEEGTPHVTRFSVMPSLIGLQQMRNRMHLAQLGKKLMKWTALATGKEQRRIAEEMIELYRDFKAQVALAFMALARGRYFYPNLNKMVLENLPPQARVTLGRISRSVAGVKLVTVQAIENEIDPYPHLGIDKGGQAIYDAKMAWLELLKMLVFMTQYRTMFLQVEEANKAANKKANVLQKLIIPRIRLTTKYIETELDEREREETFRLKRFKELKTKRKEKAPYGVCDTISEEELELEADLEPEHKEELELAADLEPEHKEELEPPVSRQASLVPLPKKSSVQIQLPKEPTQDAKQERLEHLMGHLEDVIGLSKQYKIEGLVSPSMEEFVKNRSAAGVNLTDRDFRPDCEVCQYLKRTENEKLSLVPIKPICKSPCKGTCGVPIPQPPCKGPCGAHIPPPPCKGPCGAHIPPSPCKGPCGAPIPPPPYKGPCRASIPPPPCKGPCGAPIPSLPCKGPCGASSALSTAPTSKVPCRSPSSSTCRAPCASSPAKDLYMTPAKESSTPLAPCIKKPSIPSEPAIAPSAPCKPPKPTTPGDKQICPSAAAKSEEEKEPPLEFGTFETKFKEIVKVTRLRNPDGTIQEEKQVITIRTEKKLPVKPERVESEEEYIASCSASGSDDNKQSQSSCSCSIKETKSEMITRNNLANDKLQCCISKEKGRKSETDLPKKICTISGPPPKDKKPSVIKCRLATTPSVVSTEIQNETLCCKPSEEKPKVCCSGPEKCTSSSKSTKEPCIESCLAKDKPKSSCTIKILSKGIDTDTSEKEETEIGQVVLQGCLLDALKEFLIPLATSALAGNQEDQKDESDSQNICSDCVSKLIHAAKSGASRKSFNASQSVCSSCKPRKMSSCQSSKSVNEHVSFSEKHSCIPDASMSSSSSCCSTKPCVTPPSKASRSTRSSTIYCDVEPKWRKEKDCIYKPVKRAKKHPCSQFRAGFCTCHSDSHLIGGSGFNYDELTNSKSDNPCIKNSWDY